MYTRGFFSVSDHTPHSRSHSPTHDNDDDNDNDTQPTKQQHQPTNLRLNLPSRKYEPLTQENGLNPNHDGSS